MDSILRKFLVQLCVWGCNDELEPTEEAPQDLLRELFAEFRKKCDPTKKSPLLEVRNYYELNDYDRPEVEDAHTLKLANYDEPREEDYDAREDEDQYAY